MGGSAFAERLSAAAFPRLPPIIYHALKERLLPLLQQHYTYVGVPEAEPEKLDHGDLDFIVNQPKDSSVTSVPRETIQELLGASDVIYVDANPTTNYAVPVKDGEWEAYGLLDLENHLRQQCEDRKIYYQVDVHVSPDEADWKYIIFIHAYGLLNSSLGLLARKNGLSFGAHGLKVEVGKRENYLRLSQCFEDILEFFGLSIDTYQAGFPTKDDIFQWLTTSKYFDISLFVLDSPPKRQKRDKDKLDAFYRFLYRLADSAPAQSSITEDLEDRKKRVIDEALTFFNKHQAYLDKWQEYEQEKETRRLADERRSKLRKAWSGSRVHDWAEMNGYWVGVKKIMDVVRGQLGGDDAILALINEQGEEPVRTLVIQVRDQLGIVPRKPVVEGLEPTITTPMGSTS